jgi:hypothetical protein
MNNMAKSGRNKSSWIALGVLITIQVAHATTDVDISAYYTGSWNSAGPINGSEIAAAPTDGNTGTGITFGDWDGSDVAIGPDQEASPLVLNITPVELTADPSVNALFNTFYGVSGEVNATVVFENSLGQSATFSLVGDQTIRDYNENVFTDDLQGYNTDSSYGAVTTQNWWNDYASGGNQRLDVATFVLPTSWDGTDLDSVTISDPYTTSDTDDVVLSALQVANVAPEPPSVWLIVTGLISFILSFRFFSCRQLG